MAVYSSKLDTLLIWLNENVLQGNNLRGSYLRHPLVKKLKKVLLKSPTFPTPVGETCSVSKGFRVKDRV